MNRVRSTPVLILAALLCLLLFRHEASAQTEAGFVIIAHPGVSVDSLARGEISKMFLKKIRVWEDGVPVIPFDLAPKSATREEFSNAVHKRRVSAVVSFWQRMVFSGRQAAPKEQSSSEAMMEAVRRTPGAVGYVADGTSTSGVKIIRITD
jgi:ABC-type phosphate transport system substrate-binding protein